MRISRQRQKSYQGLDKESKPRRCAWRNCPAVGSTGLSDPNDKGRIKMLCKIHYFLYTSKIKNHENYVDKQRRAIAQQLNGANFGNKFSQFMKEHRNIPVDCYAKSIPWKKKRKSI